jgi:hypothetical protein
MRGLDDDEPVQQRMRECFEGRASMAGTGFVSRCVSPKLRTLPVARAREFITRLLFATVADMPAFEPRFGRA